MGEWVYVYEELGRMINEYFMELFTSLLSNGINEVIDAVENRMDQQASEFLDLPFTPLEVKEALFQIGPTKPPGPDGMHALFYQKF